VDLSQWLYKIQALHPHEIEFGLERIRTVADRLGVKKPSGCVITVAGTNGKGSTVAMLDAVLSASGYRVGTYTSPHLLHYNERIRVFGQCASDKAICESFARIEAVRGEISLTYFEFSTLAALLIFAEARPDVVVLEVGLGGRLDAVNIVDPDLAIVSSIGIDHQDWLGDSRELIGKEKAGIFRAHIPVVCGDPDPPESLLAAAKKLDAPVYLQGIDFGFIECGSFWHWWGRSKEGVSVHMDHLPWPALDLLNAATVIQALQLASVTVSKSAIAKGLDGFGLQGRYQLLQGLLHGLMCRADVAHNPHAARLLAEKVSGTRQQMGSQNRVRAVLAMMADKDHAGFYRALESVVDIWYIAAFAEPRCQDANLLSNTLKHVGARVEGTFPSVAEALTQACGDADQGDLILVTGSFVTVAELMRYIASIHLSAPIGDLDTSVGNRHK
jgi:dihydrofolate synthase/folylpolyglutamate synthase